MEENENENKNENGNQKKKEKECLFSFAKINKYFIIPFLCPIFCTICNYFINIISMDEGLKNKQCFLSILECGTLLGSGFFYCISSIKEKNEEMNKNPIISTERISAIKLIYNDSGEYIKKKKIIIICLLLLMSFSVSFFDIIEVNTFNKHTLEERFYLIWNLYDLK